MCLFSTPVAPDALTLQPMSPIAAKKLLQHCAWQLGADELGDNVGGRSVWTPCKRAQDDSDNAW